MFTQVRSVWNFQCEIFLFLGLAIVACSGRVGSEWSEFAQSDTELDQYGQNCHRVAQT